jgi:alpha-ketoglutarate-dependent taurine dioxygenase
VLDSIDASRPLGADVIGSLERAVEAHSVVLLRGQTLCDESQLAFTRQFGELEVNHISLGREGKVSHLYRIGNIDKDGNQLPSSDTHVRFSTGNEMWYVDPAMAT